MIVMINVSECNGPRRETHTFCQDSVLFPLDPFRICRQNSEFSSDGGRNRIR